MADNVAFRAGLRETLGSPRRFALLTVLGTIALLVVPLPRAPVASLPWWALLVVVGTAVRAYRARSKGLAYQLAILVVNAVGGAWFVGLVATRIGLGLRAGLFERVGWSLPIPALEYLLLGGLTLFVLYSLVARWRNGSSATT